jgi:ABC-type lipoprotein export system ATPase subunit
VNRGADVRLEHVYKSFENGSVRALDDVSFEIAAGEFVSLTGPSGVGKSTLLNLIGALDTPDRGVIAVDGRSLAKLDDPSAYRATTVGFVFQFHNLIPTLNALENVQVPMIGRGLVRGARQEHALTLLQEVGLAHRMHARPGTLSGGERQRVAIARALANGPRLLLADEPTGALDGDTAREVIEALVAAREHRGTTIFLVTNDAELALRADRALRLRDGVIRDEAPRPASVAPHATPDSSRR